MHGEGHLKKGGSLLREGIELRYQFIDEEKAMYPIRVLCKVMEVSASGFYAKRIKIYCRSMGSSAQ